MIERKLLRRELPQAILARIPVPEHDAFPGDGTVKPRHLPIDQKPNHAGNGETDPRSPDHDARCLLHDRRAFEDKRQGAPGWYDMDWLIRCVEDERQALQAHGFIMVGRAGFEPAASRLKGEYTSTGVTDPKWWLSSESNAVVLACRASL